jgi:hypothetical protein
MVAHDVEEIKGNNLIVALFETYPIYPEGLRETQEEIKVEIKGNNLIVTLLRSIPFIWKD